MTPPADGKPTGLLDRVRRQILSGSLRPGERIVQDRLAKELEVSRIPLREVLRTLAAEGLVVTLPGGGMAVADLDVAQVEELYDLRSALEPTLADQMVAGCSRRDIAALRELTAHMESLEPASIERSMANNEFHEQLYALADRPLTLQFVQQLLRMSEPVSRRWVATPGDLPRIHAEHRGMVDALADGDADRLAALIRSHIEGARKHLEQEMGRAR